MNKLYEKEKGLPTDIDVNYYLKDNKIIRNLSQISYRLLNYILYSNLFFARIFTRQERFDKYKPKEMSWGEIINESYILLKKELEKKGINSIEIFMNYIFKDLFEKLHEIEIIDEYKKLVDIENELEKLIQEKIEKTYEEIKKYNEKIDQNSDDKNDYINLLKEKYNKYNKEEYPYYEYFYYSDCLDEKYIMEKVLIHEDKNKFPIMNKYLEFKMNKKNVDDKYSLDKLSLFNKVLNLINDKYSHKITRLNAEKTLIKDTELYKNAENSILIDKFINYYNELKNKDSKGNEIALNVDINTLSDLVIDDSNEIGKTYKKIYKIFIDKQNDALKDILEIKIKNGIFNSNCRNKINIQQIREDEIFILNTTEKFSFIDTVYNSSYRKIIDSQNEKNYNTFEINMPGIEENMTDLLLKNKKLLNKDLIIDFSYNNEIFDYQLNDMLITFQAEYNTRDTSISMDDKKYFYNYVKDNKNLEKYEDTINNFITLIEFLNNSKKEENCEFRGDSLISQAIAAIDDSISADFKEIFEEKTELTVSKLSELFDYYLRLIFVDIKNEMMKYQEEKEQKGQKEENEEKETEEQKVTKPKEIISNLDEKITAQLDEYYKKKDIIIGKEELENAIRLFITLVLFREKDKENKIKLNRKNLIDYLKSPDLWDIKVYKNENFHPNLNELKLIKIQINQTILLFNYLTGGKEIDEFKIMEENIKEENQTAAELPPINNPEDVQPQGENSEEE